MLPKTPKSNSPWWAEWLFALALLAMMLAATGIVRAAPIAEAGGNGVKVMLYDEPCALAAVVNLAKRGTWTQAGTVIEGCWAVSNGLVLCYWADRTIIAIPSSVFTRVSGT